MSRTSRTATSSKSWRQPHLGNFSPYFSLRFLKNWLCDVKNGFRLAYDKSQRREITSKRADNQLFRTCPRPFSTCVGLSPSTHTQIHPPLTKHWNQQGQLMQTSFSGFCKSLRETPRQPVPSSQLNTAMLVVIPETCCCKCHQDALLRRN